MLDAGGLHMRHQQARVGDNLHPFFLLQCGEFQVQQTPTKAP